MERKKKKNYKRKNGIGFALFLKQTSYTKYNGTGATQSLNLFQTFHHTFTHFAYNSQQSKYIQQKQQLTRRFSNVKNARFFLQRFCKIHRFVSRMSHCPIRDTEPTPCSQCVQITTVNLQITHCQINKSIDTKMDVFQAHSGESFQSPLLCNFPLRLVHCAAFRISSLWATLEERVIRIEERFLRCSVRVDYMSSSSSSSWEELAC